MSSREFNVGGTPAIERHPIQEGGEVEILLFS